MTKKCNKCNLELDIDLFYFRKDTKIYRNECKKCFYNSRKEYKAKYKKDNAEIIKQKNKTYNNLKSTKERQIKWRKSNKKNLLKYGKEYRIRRADNIRQINKKYYSKNKDKIIDNGRIYKNNRYKSDLLYKLIKIVRSNINYSIKNKGYSKKSKTYEILGCSFEEFKNYIENQFELWMTWENQGLYNGELNYGWDIDHIIPLSSAKTEEELLKLCHYTNLQPLDSHINRNIKKNKIK